MFMCSGLLIASKYKTKVFSKFTQFDEKGSCSISKSKSYPAFENLQLCLMNMEPLLNKPHVNEVTLTGQNLPLKCY